MKRFLDGLRILRCKWFHHMPERQHSHHCYTCWPRKAKKRDA